MALRFFGRHCDPARPVPVHCRQYLELTVAVPARDNSHDRAHLEPWNLREGGGGPSAGRWERRLDALPRLQVRVRVRVRVGVRVRVRVRVPVRVGVRGRHGIIIT